MKTIVTGAGGFIGRALIERLCRDSHTVTAAVRQPATLPVPTQVVGDIDAETEWGTVLEGADCVVHLAA